MYLIQACTLKWQGDFSLDLGDRVTIDGYETYILSRKLSYTGGLREGLFSSGEVERGEEQYWQG